MGEMTFEEAKAAVAAAVELGNQHSRRGIAVDRTTYIVAALVSEIERLRARVAVLEANDVFLGLSR
jgi:hypothetical protein